MLAASSSPIARPSPKPASDASRAGRRERRRQGPALARARARNRRVVRAPGRHPGDYRPVVVAVPGDEAATPSSTGVAGRQPVAASSRAQSAQVSGTSPGCSGSGSRIAGRPSAALERGDEVEELDRGAVADVVDPERRRRGAGVGGRRVPGRVGRRDDVGGADHPLGDVVDVGEVAAVAAGVEEPDRPALADRVGEDHRRHVGPAPGAVDGEEAQGRCRAGRRDARRRAPSARSPAWWRRRTAAGGRPPGPRRRASRCWRRRRSRSRRRPGAGSAPRRQASSTWVKPVEVAST